MDFASLNQSLTKRGLESVLKVQKRVKMSVESAASKTGGLGVFIDPTQKLAVYRAIGTYRTRLVLLAQRQG